MKKALVVVLLMVLGAVASAATSAPQSPAQLEVAVYVDPPFVTRTADGFGGFAIELWEKIASGNGWKVEYIEAHTLPELIKMVGEGKADVGVTDLFITSKRLKQVDFSQPYFDSGLQVMIDNSRTTTGLADLVRGLAEWGHLRIFAIAFGVMMVATIVLTIVDRRLDPEFPRQWGSGLAESFYHIMSTSAAGSSYHKRVIPGAVGHLLAGVFLGCAVVTVAYITSSMTSVMTINKIRGHIASIQDLAGKKVATIVGSTGEGYCRSMGLNMQTFDDIQSAVQALLARQVDAIVYDSPILRYYDKEHPELPISEVGPVFDPRKYGFALPPNSPIRVTIDEQLLKLSEDGYTDGLNHKYFADIQ